jgi:hypothetical protein
MKLIGHRKRILHALGQLKRPKSVRFSDRVDKISAEEGARVSTLPKEHDPVKSIWKHDPVVIQNACCNYTVRVCRFACCSPSASFR